MDYQSDSDLRLDLLSMITDYGFWRDAEAREENENIQEAREENVLGAITLLEMGNGTVGNATVLVAFINSIGDSLSMEDYNDVVIQFLDNIMEYGQRLMILTPDGELALTSAARIQGEGGTAIVDYLLLDPGGSPIDGENAFGNTALHVAAETGQLTSADLLIDLGADVNKRNNDHKTPLDYATNNEIIELLKNHGAISGLHQRALVRAVGTVNKYRRIQAGKKIYPELTKKLIEQCCSKNEGECSICKEPLSTNWVIAVKHVDHSYRHCMHLSDLEAMILSKKTSMDEHGQTREHELERGHYECPLCKEQEMPWRYIINDIKEFHKKNQFAKKYFEKKLTPKYFEGGLSPEGLSVEEGIPSRDLFYQGKVTHIFKCPDDKGKGKEEKITKKRKRSAYKIQNETKEGYEVNQSSWDKFITFITSKSDLLKLSQPTLLELCTSLRICGKRKTKIAIVIKLLDYFQKIIPSLKPKVVPRDLMTVYCSNPLLYCKEGIPQNLNIPDVQSAYLSLRRRKLLLTHNN